MDTTQDDIDKEVKLYPILLYMKGTQEAPQCGFSARVVNILKELNATFVTRNVLEDSELREGIKKYSNWPTLPQLYIKGAFIGGCDIVKELHKQGELAKLI